jgi:hypothetical protein
MAGVRNTLNGLMNPLHQWGSEAWFLSQTFEHAFPKKSLFAAQAKAELSRVFSPKLPWRKNDPSGGVESEKVSPRSLRSWHSFARIEGWPAPWFAFA